MCGTIHIPYENNTIRQYNWNVNVTWKSKPNMLKVLNRDIISNELPFSDNCGDWNNLLVFTKDRQNKVILLRLWKNKLKRLNELPYLGKLYYLFKRPSDSSKMEQIYPCEIYKPINKKPKIIIEGFNSTLYKFKDKEINVIKLDKINTLLSIKLYLEGEEKPLYFYENEKILIEEVSITMDGIKDIVNSNKIITNSFMLQKFQLLKFSYELQMDFQNLRTTEIFYFAPLEESYELPLEVIVHSSTIKVIKPNCSMNMFNFGYLYSIDYEGKTIEIDMFFVDGYQKNNFVRSGSYIYMNNVKKNEIKLKCLYKTANGNFSIFRLFKLEIQTIEINKKEQDFHILKNPDDIYGKLPKELQKTWHNKLMNKIGSSWKQSIFGGIVFFVITIILFVAVLCCQRLLKQRNEKKELN
ncbi:Hypothetical protein SRAE_1000296700 [Strongyloides ratti]|uniref:Uncharacterized protein n=1 Tax=Strongyloides ratti TaxID=34506 RepID=A0A090MX29_STRRB|nr:Hypothetical protein SRAE_1000296700 [Strongyloides ratti]CEF64714.1 Hypothetical protein SRAE_1000296700 [Strongyloides ratti]